MRENAPLPGHVMVKGLVSASGQAGLQVQETVGLVVSP